MGAAGEEFDSWYRRVHPLLGAALYLIAGSSNRAAVAADEALARALADWPRVSAMAAPEAWTYRVAANYVHRSLRRRALEARLLRRMPPLAPPPPSQVELWDLVARLPLRQRTAVVLRYVADLPEAEIAVAMRITRGTVASSLARAQRRLAELLESEGESEGAVRG